MEMLGLVLLIVFGGATLIALLNVIGLILPLAVERARLRLEAGLGKSFLLGLVNLLFFGVIALILIWLAGLIRDSWSGLFAFVAVMLAFIALLIVLLLAILTLNGLSALAVLLGGRIGAAPSPFWSQARGGLLLVLAGLTPYVGWFLFTPFAVCISLGASLRALFQKQPPASAEEAAK